ncbi:MAG: hypothetical protein G01um101444_86 [Parcubacteria group bacterium Gr01-1014_44]|nr:MAG: hypothetical protein G01um101444_86 [Parcubacteria group bacterium Gr01-1014_44]
MNGRAVIKTNDPNLTKLSEELINSGVIQVVGQVAPDTCWLDSTRCPYGYPEGTFEKRPVSCFMGDGGCGKLNDHKSDIVKFSGNLIEAESEPKLREVFDRFGITLSSELVMLADGGEYEISELEKTILVAAANIIEREEKNEDRAPIDNKIIRRKDFEAEL